MTDYQDRQKWDLDAWPEMYGVLKQLQGLVFLSPPGIELNLMVFTVSSQAAGCRHCQARRSESPSITPTGISGAHNWNSRTQFVTRGLGQINKTLRASPLQSRNRIVLIACIVLPSPISSARIPEYRGNKNAIPSN